MIALIDADIVAHRIGFTTEADEEWIAKSRTDEMLDGILADTQATEYQLWLSDTLENNWRYHLCNDYKANRVQPKPKHYEFIKEYLITEWGARIAHGQEADDALGIEQTKNNTKDALIDLNSVICSIDKDLKQITGRHYNFVKKEYDEISPIKGLRHFYHQLLKGDSGDNIGGAPGVGEKRAGILLGNLTSEPAIFEAVVNGYRNGFKKYWGGEWDDFKEKQMFNIMLLNGRLLKIKQKEDEGLWNLPDAKLMADLTS